MKELTLDLKKFCSKDRFRDAITEPFSRGEWSYATNGHLLIRVPRRDDIAEIENSPQVERLWPKEAPNYRVPSTLILPPPKEEDCRTCNGRGTQHDCPDCGCNCEDCGGTGHISTDRNVGIMVGKTPIAMQYARVLLSLPGIEIDDISIPAAHAFVMQFRFDGGDGILAILRDARARGWTVSKVHL